MSEVHIIYKTMNKLKLGQQYKLTSKKSNFQMKVMCFGELKFLGDRASAYEIIHAEGMYDLKVSSFTTKSQSWNPYDFVHNPTLRDSLGFDWSIFMINKKPRVGISSADLENYIIEEL